MKKVQTRTGKGTVTRGKLRESKEATATGKALRMGRKAGNPQIGRFQ